MTAADVLAVMDADGRAVACVIDECKSWDRAQKWKDHLTWHDEARAAVAELLDKADSLLTLGASDTGIRELRAALARCKGEGA